jgi:DNA topoisomerase-1
VRALARDLPRIRESLYRDFCRTDFCRERVLAAVVRLISDGFFRVGSERYLKENRTFGISTLHKTHVRVDGPCLIFEYRGKRGIYHRQVVVDPELAEFVGQLLAAPGRRLFRYQDGDTWCDPAMSTSTCGRHWAFGTPRKISAPGGAHSAWRRCWPSWGRRRLSAKRSATS